MFAFQKWSSLAEMRRYMKRFINLIEGLPRLGGVMRTKYNHYDSVVRPMKKYLEEKGVKFEMGKEVVDIDFNLSDDKKTATVLHLKDKTEIVLGKDDFVLITNGSITESSDNGTWDTPAKLKGIEESGSWKLWKKLATKDKAFGNPDQFVIISVCKNGIHLQPPIKTAPFMIIWKTFPAMSMEPADWLH